IFRTDSRETPLTEPCGVADQTAIAYKGMGGGRGGWSAQARPNFSTMDTIVRFTMKLACPPSLLALMLCTLPHPLRPQAPVVPAWAQPGSATHVQVAPPPDFHRSSRNFDTPIGIFEGQSDIGSALLPGSASYHAATKQYTINSAGYNVWY